MILCPNWRPRPLSCFWIPGVWFPDVWIPGTGVGVGLTLYSENWIWGYCVVPAEVPADCAVFPGLLAEAVCLPEVSEPPSFFESPPFFKSPSFFIPPEEEATT